MRLHDGILGLIIVIAGAIIFAVSSTFPSQFDGSPGPALFPMVLSAAFGLCGLVLFLKNIKGIGAVLLRDRELSLRGFINIVITALTIVFYVYVSEYLGFLITGFIVLLVLMLMLRTKPVKAVIAAAVTAVVIYLIFAKGLLVPLPEGLLAF